MKMKNNLQMLKILVLTFAIAGAAVACGDDDNTTNNSTNNTTNNSTNNTTTNTTNNSTTNTTNNSTNNTTNNTTNNSTNNSTNNTTNNSTNTATGDPGSDIVYVSLEADTGDYLGFGMLAYDGIDSTDNGYDLGSNLDGTQPDFADVCPEFLETNVTALGCGGIIAVRFLDTAGDPVAIEDNMQIRVFEFGQQCPSGSDADDYSVSLCTDADAVINDSNLASCTVSVGAGSGESVFNTTGATSNFVALITDTTTGAGCN